MLCRLLILGLFVTIAGSSLVVPRGGSSASDPATAPVRAGIIGLDTSHVTAFTQLLNAANPPAELAGVRVVAGYPGGSADIPASRDRVAGFTRELHEKYGVEIVDSIETLLKKVDVIMLESVDGRPHLGQARAVFQARKPVFIDKPVAGTLADAIAIFELARESGTPCFSSSSLRFSPGVAGMKQNPKVGDVIGCDTYGPCHLEEHHPDLYWYGVHGVESLFTIMGTGCQSATRVQTAGTDLAAGVWNGGRVGTFRGLRQGASGYGSTVFGSKGIVAGGRDGGYEPLVAEICKFFRTGKPPVSAEETIEIFAFMEAADESKRQGGKPVALESVMTRARADLAARGLK
jgi:hypothetical protein